MKTRLLSTVLWFFAAWYVGNILAAVLGANALVGPIVGIAAGTLVGLDPFRVLWTHGTTGQPSVASSPGR